MLRPLNELQQQADIELEGPLGAGIISDYLPFVEYKGVTFHRSPLDAERHNSKTGVNCGIAYYGFANTLDASICQILKNISFRHEAKRGVIPLSRWNPPPLIV